MISDPLLVSACSIQPLHRGFFTRFLLITRLFDLCELFPGVVFSRKARRAMKEVRSARDPEYKTLELDMSEWESAKIMKKTEINMDDFEKKLQATQ